MEVHSVASALRLAVEAFQSRPAAKRRRQVSSLAVAAHKKKSVTVSHPAPDRILALGSGGSPSSRVRSIGLQEEKTGTWVHVKLPGITWRNSMGPRQHTQRGRHANRQRTMPPSKVEPADCCRPRRDSCAGASEPSSIACAPAADPQPASYPTGLHAPCSPYPSNAALCDNPTRASLLRPPPMGSDRHQTQAPGAQKQSGKR